MFLFQIALAGINLTPSTSTGMAPTEILLGRDIIYPHELKDLKKGDPGKSKLV